MKKILGFVFGILLFSCHSYAAPLPFQGITIAAGIGGTFTKFSTNQVATDQPRPPNFFNAQQSQNPNLYASHVIGSFGLGFTQRFLRRYAIGIEGTADIGDSSAAHTVATTISGIMMKQSIAAKLKNNFALLFKPGFILNPTTLIYAMVGPRWGNFKTSATSSLKTGSSVGNSTTFANNSNYEVGVTTGIGLEEILGHGLSFTLEYFYTCYGHVAMLTSSAPLLQVPNARLLQVAKVDVETNSVLLSALYRFSW